MPPSINKAFMDTAYAVTLSMASDKHHEKALQLSYQLEADGTELITTRAVMMEIGNALSKIRYRGAAADKG